ncbi:hypothetical protein [Amycolatopsis jiangsuensis]|uniref:ABC-type Na+ efflux pump permease subunit n=1 Tax=Amycolatopsis jiangsuensis TaxID=1181879 RepID=A0A840ITL3_9PSEU|nr:hypothetical protein [Amycolatopsis jiangsuensis]MBB4684562.1 ABC-type Na+ efflux pump permease subunit [Amycolatopsis jiangsuensis]
MTEPDEQPRRGLGVAAVAVAAVSFVLALCTWMAWLLVRPKLLTQPVYPIVTQVFLLVLGALWFVVLPAGVLAVVLGLTGGGRRRGGDLARAGALLGALTFVVALAGAVTFTVDPMGGGQPHRLGGTYGSYFGR